MTRPPCKGVSLHVKLVLLIGGGETTVERFVIRIKPFQTKFHIVLRIAIMYVDGLLIYDLEMC